MINAKTDHQQAKLQNRDFILRTIFDHAPLSRADIARRTHLTRTTVSAQVAALLAEGLVEEVGFGPSSGGKAPILLQVANDARYLISLNLAYDRFTGAIINLAGEIKTSIQRPVKGQQGSEAQELVCDILEHLLQQAWQPIVGIGISTPGLVNTREGRIIQAVNLGWKEFPLARNLAERYGLPVVLLNDSQAAAIGEFRYGGWQVDNLLVVNVRHGIGAGLLIQGKLFQGDNNAAGEIGHLVVEPQGRLCRCGRRGCLETVASASAIRILVQTLAPRFPTTLPIKPPEALTPQTLGTAFAAGDPLAEKVMGDAAFHLGRTLAHLTAMLDTNTILLTGDAPYFGPAWLSRIQQTMRDAMLISVAPQISLYPGRLPFARACLLGAAAYMLLDNYRLLYLHSS